jgi:hypothetical protein
MLGTAVHKCVAYSSTGWTVALAFRHSADSCRPLPTGTHAVVGLVQEPFDVHVTDGPGLFLATGLKPGSQVAVHLSFQ